MRDLTTISMSEGIRLTGRDYNQIPQYEHDEDKNAKRVVVVGQEITIDSDKIANCIERSVLEGLSGFKLDMPKAVSYTPIEIEKTVFLPQIEIKTIEVPVIIKEIEYREIEKPIIVQKIVTVERPVIIKEIEFKEVYKEKEFPKWHKVCTIIQAISVLSILILQFLSHIK